MHSQSYLRYPTSILTQDLGMSGVLGDFTYFRLLLCLLQMDAAPHLDGNFVVFGEVINGMDVVEEVNSYGRKDGTAAVPIIITNCGQIVD